MIRSLLLLLLCAATLHAQPAAPGRQSAGAAEDRVSRHFERLREDPLALRAFLRAMPKGADLHTHLTGAVYAESYVTWAAEMPLCIDLATFGFVEADATDTPSDPSAPAMVMCRNPATERPASDALRDPSLYRRVIDALSTRHWHTTRTAGHYQFFDAFQRFGPAARAGRLESSQVLAKSIAEVMERAGRQNVLHLELLMAFEGSQPEVAGIDLSRGGATQFSAYRERLLEGGIRGRVADRRRWLDAVEQETRAILGCDQATSPAGCAVSVRYVTYALRGLPPQTVFGQLVFAFELAAADPRMAGVNLVMPEDWFVPMRDYGLHMEMFAFLRRLHPDVHVALHAGELSFGLVPPERLGLHVREAIDVAGAVRIGHGTDIMYGPDPAELLAAMARRRIAVEISLSSSDVILGVRGASHPLRHYLRAGVPVVLCTDDEGVARSDLTNEYQRAVQEHGLTYAEVKQISRNSIEHSFLGRDEKRRMQQRLEAALTAFEAKIVPR